MSTTSQSNIRTPSGPALHHDEPHHAVFPRGGDFFAWAAIGIVGAVLLFVSVTAGELFSPGIRQGDVAEKDIIATHNATIVDAAATKKAIEDAREHVIPVFRIDRSRDQPSIDSIKRSLAIVKQLQEAGISPASELQAFNITPEEHLFALTCPEEDFKVLTDPSPQGTTAPLLNKVMESLRIKLLNPARAPSQSSDPSRTERSSARSERSARTGPSSARTGRSSARAGRSSLRAVRLRTPQVASSADAVLALNRQRHVLSEFVKPHKALTNNEIFIAISVKQADLSAFINSTVDSTRRLCDRFERFPVNDKMYWHGTVSEFLPDQWSEDLRRHVATLICFALEPNVVIDPGATKTKADEATRAVQPIRREIKEGEVVVRRGEVVTEDRLAILQLLAIKSVKSPTLLIVLGISLLTAIGFFALFLLTYEPQHFFSTTSIALLYTIGIVTSIIASICGNGFAEFVPVPAAALILTIFFGRRVASAMILPLVLVLAVDGILSGVSLLSLSCGAIAAIATYTKQRNALVFTGLAVGLAQAGGFVLAFALGKLIMFFFGPGAYPAITSSLMMDFPSGAPTLQSIGLQFGGGIASAIIAIGSLPFLENIFGLITPYRLIELTDAEQPLLRQLEEKAPGTYQHSLAVANLAEAGAKAINADANLVRAGAMYHDIGKMVKPRFFIENQLGATNPHDSMTPEESRERVLAHVTDGIELAKKYSLPQAVQDFIPMHQGSTLMAYFYHKACLRDGVENVDPNFYRYPGPKPHSKETAIVMLADVSEAVTHSMKDPSEEEVDTAIEKVFDNRWQDGQFTESGLTFDELQRVRLAFVRVWRTLHHDRLKYPATTTGRMPVAPNSVSNPGTDATAVAPEPPTAMNGATSPAPANARSTNSADTAPVASEPALAINDCTTPDASGASDAAGTPGASDAAGTSGASGASGEPTHDLGCDCSLAIFGPPDDRIDINAVNPGVGKSQSSKNTARKKNHGKS